MSQHLRLPLSLASDGTFQTVAEDSDAEVVQNVSVILLTRTGERLATPDFGTPDPTFTGFDSAAFLPVVEQYEPRANATAVTDALSFVTTVTPAATSFDLSVYEEARYDDLPVSNTQAVEVTHINVRRQEG